MIPSTEPIRKMALDILDLLGSPDEQRKYQAAVPYVSAMTEMLCMWSDDFYHPETPEFRAAFSEDERKVLQDFDDAFNEVCQHLHGASVPTEQFIGSALGCELASGAKKALACLQKQDRKDISIPKERH